MGISNKNNKEIALGHFLLLKVPTGSNTTVTYKYQNFFINKNVDYPATGTTKKTYMFVPFTFSGVTISSDGAGTDASLIFPANEIAKNWAVDAVNNFWIAEVATVIVNPDNSADFFPLSVYRGKVSTGGWGDTTVALVLDTILDAVGADVPRRKITTDLVGNIPLSSSVQLF
tara:strand:- start:354 stop:869 length:516 start_codon:yes stop_codon:yes gene_type:complete